MKYPFQRVLGRLGRLHRRVQQHRIYGTRIAIKELQQEKYSVVHLPDGMLAGELQGGVLRQMIVETCSTAVERKARARLRAAGYHPLRNIRCRFRDGTLTLHGRVPSFFHKQLAQEAIRSVNSIHSIVNKIEVPGL